MSNSSAEKNECAPSAPPSYHQYESNAAMRAPPPTYEESQRNSAAGSGVCHPTAHAATNQYYGMTYHQQLPIRWEMDPLQNAAASVYPAAQGQAGPSTSTPDATCVLNLHPRAEVRRTNTGAVIIPPPPPGCLPAPAQLAAMQGQNVILKQKKRPFF